jgi:predicted RNase H-like HicB family nuclease
MKTMSSYTVVLHPESNGTYTAYLPAIAGCHAFGSTREEAQAELQYVFEMIVEEYEQDGKSLPNDVEILVKDAR